MLKRALSIFLIGMGTGSCTVNHAPTNDQGHNTGADQDSQPPGDAGDSNPGDGEGDGITPADDDTPPPPAAHCERTLTNDSSEACHLVSGDSSLLIQGNILMPDGIVEAGELLIDAGNIVCAACDCTPHPAATNAAVLTCPDALVSPGLINTHDHISFTQARPITHSERYDHRHEWRKGKNGKTKLSVSQNSHSLGDAWGEIRQVLAGTTSLLGSGGQQGGFLRNLDRSNLLEGLQHGAANNRTFPLGDSGGSMHSSGCGNYNIDDPQDARRDPAYLAHVAEGISDAARNEFLCLSGETPSGADLVFETSAFVHGIGVTATDVLLMSGDGAGLIWSPRSNTDLYGHTAVAPMWDRLGALISLGTDWSATGSINLLRELACAERWNDEHWEGYFSDSQLVAMVTSGAAEIAGFGDVLGSLTPGRAADITLWDGRDHPGYRAILDASPKDVLLVLRGGSPLYGDADLVESLTPAADCEQLEVCGADKRVCAQGELGTPVAALRAELGNDTYDLFFCGTPEDEPTCIPSRPGEYEGLVTQGDLDGDGVPEDLDNCPLSFNPPRPMDGDQQPDADGDGDGDACDPCPVTPDTTACATLDPSDGDGDGVANAADNCPAHANPTQEDTDNDGTGDACDGCPAHPNPANAPCPATVYDIKQGVATVDQSVAVDGLLATAHTEHAFWATTDPSSDEWQGEDHAAVFVWNPNHEQPIVGSRVLIYGVVAEYYGQRQIQATDVWVDESDISPPVPIEASVADVTIGGSRAQALEGALIRLNNVEVTNTTPAGSAGETVAYEFEIDGGLSVDDYIYQLAPQPSEGTRFGSITGVLAFQWSRNKLLPRSADDISQEAAGLQSIGPNPVYIYVGQSGATSPPLMVYFSAPVAAETRIEVSSDTPEIATPIDSGTTLQPGTAQGEVLIDAISAGGPLTITASSGDSLVTTQLIVLGPETTVSPVVLTPSPATTVVGGTITFTLQLDLPAPPAGVEVALTTTTLEGAATPVVPNSIHVPAFSMEATFDVDVGTNDGRLLLIASVGANSVESELRVETQPTVGLLLSEILYNPPGNDDGLEWVKIYNGTDTTIALDGWSLGWGGSDYLTGTVQLSGSVGAGECFLIGAEQSTATNGNPSPDLVLDFEPDLENATSAAGDGVGLFSVPADALTSGSIPVDAVVYGGSNDSGFLSPEGLPFANAHVPDAGSGNSIVRADTDTWAVNETPNSQACVIVR